MLVWSAINVFFNLLIISFIYIEQDETFHTSSTIGKILDIIQVLASILTHLVMVVESVAKKNVEIEMWNTIGELDVDFTRLQTRITNRKMIQSFLIKFGIVHVVGVMAEVFIVASLYKTNLPWTRSWIFRLWSLLVVRLGNSQLIFFTEVMSHHMRIIINELELIAETTQKLSTIKSVVLTKQINLLKRIYNRIYKISFLVNQRLGWSTLTNFSNNFIVITIGLYWIYSRIHFGVLAAIERM